MNEHEIILLQNFVSTPDLTIIIPPDFIAFSTRGALPTILIFSNFILLFSPSAKNNEAWLITSPSTVICPLSLTTSLIVDAEIVKQLPFNVNSELAFCILDIANISDINNELGHAKGDEVIKLVFERDLLAEDGFLIFEHSKDRNYENHPFFWQSRSYGSVQFSFFRKV